MVVKLFLLGRPGCGKSSAAQRIEDVIRHMHKQEFSTHRFKDFDILEEMSKNEKYSRMFTRTVYNGFEGFDVEEASVLDIALERLDEGIRNYMVNAKTNQIILIEFARENYGKALKKFSSAVLQDAHFLFINLELEDCIKRIQNRMLAPKSSDDHYISEKMLMQYYTNQNFPIPNDLVEEKFKLTDNRGSLVERKFKLVDNHGPLKDFEGNVDNFIKEIIK